MEKTDLNESVESSESIMHPTLISIDSEVRKKSVEILNATLATFIDLYGVLKTAHWNVKGIVFISLHKLFDDLAANALEMADGIAERIVALGGTAIGTLNHTVSKTKLSEFKVSPFDGASYLYQIAQNYSLIGEHLRWASKELDEMEDLTTANYYLELAMDVDKNLYFVESHLQLNLQ